MSEPRLVLTYATRAHCCHGLPKNTLPVNEEVAAEDWMTVEESMTTRKSRGEFSTCSNDEHINSHKLLSLALVGPSAVIAPAPTDAIVLL